MAIPWSRGCVVHWHPTPRIYDRRSRLIEVLDEQFGVLRYKVESDRVSVVLGNSIEVSVGLENMAFHSLLAGSVGAEAKQLVSIAELIQGELKPDPPTARFAFQHLVAWPESGLDSVRAFRIGARAALNLGDEYTFADVAVLADVDWPGRDSQFQVEYGVVEAEQAPLRIARILGRATGHRPTQHDVLMNRQYPPIATFVDSTWPVLFSDTEVGWIQVMHDEFIAADAEAGRFADLVHDGFVAHRTKEEMQS